MIVNKIYKQKINESSLRENIKYSLGYNHDIAMLDMIKPYIHNISEIYFPIPSDLLGSGRGIMQRNKYRDEILRIINFCKEHRIGSNLLINPSCEGKFIGDERHMARTLKYVIDLSEQGLSSVTLTNPLYVELIKKHIPSMEIQVSVISSIDSVEKANFFKNLGASVVIPERDKNRNLNFLKELKAKSGMKLKIMVNEGCINSCIFRNMHYNYVAHHIGENDQADLFCFKVMKQKPHFFFKSAFVRPEEIKLYAGITNEFKLVTRLSSTDKIKKMIEAYSSQNYDGDLSDILDSVYQTSFFSKIDNKKIDRFGFFNKLADCDKDCNNCNYCEQLVKECCVLK